MDTSEPDMTQIEDVVTNAISDIIRDPTPNEESRFFSKLNPSAMPMYGKPYHYSTFQYEPQEYIYQPTGLWHDDQYYNYFPTKVINATNLTETTTENDLREKLGQYGNIFQIVLNNWHALIEFDCKEAAQKWVNAYQLDNKVYINNQQIILAFTGQDSISLNTPISTPHSDHTVLNNNSRSENQVVFDHEAECNTLADTQGTNDYSPYSSQGYGFPSPMNPHMTSIPAALNYNGGKHKSTDGWILISSGFPEDITPYSIFRLFSLYGNVKKVKIMFKKRDTALIQYMDGYQAKLAKLYLNGCEMKESQLKVNYSKSDYIIMPKKGTTSEENALAQDFTYSKEHRYKIAGSRNFQNIAPPSKTLHLSNLPNDITEEKLLEIFENVHKFCKIKFFAVNDKKMAHAEYETVSHAIDIIIHFHNYNIEGRYLKLSFSKGTW
jgi:RNA recognition motif-containing protein